EPHVMTSSKPSLRDLVAVNLRYDPGVEALNIRAIAQLVAKILFAAGRAVSKSPRELAREGANVIKVSKIAVSQVESSLLFLKNLRFAKEYEGRWLLTDEGYAAVEADVGRAEKRVAGVLDRHFAHRIDRTKLTEWFRDACISFYGEYGSQWAAALARKSD